MEIRALWEVLLRRWWLILLPVLVAFLSLLPTLPGIISPASLYNVGIRFTAAAPAEALPPAEAPYEDRSYVPWLASEYVVINFPPWVTSDTFAQEVSAELAAEDIDISYEDVRSAFASDSSRSILVVYLTWDDQHEIEAMARAAITVLQERSQDYFPQFAAQPARVIPLDEVRVNEVPPGLMSRLMPLFRLGVALAAGIALAALAEYLDDTIHGVEELEALGISIVGMVPIE